MAVTPFAIGRLLSDLVGRRVEAKLDPKAAFSPATRTAGYEVQPTGGTAAVKLDFALLAALAGTMIGYPAAEIERQVRAEKFDENTTDAALEVMNVLSAVIVEQNRAVFKGLFATPAEYSADAVEALKDSFYPLKLQVTLTGFKAGTLLIGVRG